MPKVKATKLKPKATKAGKTRAARRASKGKPCGRIPFLLDDKIDFCVELRSTWQDAVKDETVGSFYDKSTNDFLLQFGYPSRPTDWKPDGWDEDDASGSDEDDGEDDGPDEDDAQEAGPSTRPSRRHPADTEEELDAAWKSKHRVFVRDKLSTWFRNNGNSAGAGTGRVKTASALSKQFDSIVDMVPVKPRRQHEDQYFSTKYYEPMVKALFDSHFEVISSTWQASQCNSDRPDSTALPSEDDIHALASIIFEDDPLFAKIYEDWLQDYRTRGVRLCEVKLRAAYTCSVYRAQPAEFQRRLKEEVDDAYDKDMEQYRKLVEAADEEKTPEYYDRMWSQAAYFLYPFAEHLQKKLGACVSILLTAPVGANRGAIGMKSVHAGTTSDVRSLKWNDADWDGFKAMEASFCRFGGQCYTQEQRAARVIQTAATTPELDVASEQQSLSPGLARIDAPPPGSPEGSMRSNRTVSSARRLGTTRQAPASSPSSPPLHQTLGPSSPYPRPSNSPPSRQLRTPATVHMPQRPNLSPPLERTAAPTQPQGPVRRTPLFLPGSSSASTHLASGATNNERRRILTTRTTPTGPLPSGSQPATQPSRAVSQPSARGAPSHPAGSKRVVSTPAAGSLAEQSRHQSNRPVPIDPVLIQAGSSSRYRQRESPQAPRTPPLSPLIPGDEPLVARRFSPPGFALGPNGEMQSLRPPYIRRPYPSNGNDAAGELEELAWNMVEDKRQREWDGVEDSPSRWARSAGQSQRNRRLTSPDSDNPFATMPLAPKTPSHSSGPVMLPRPRSPLASLFTQHFQDASSSPAPSPAQKRRSIQPPPSDSWPPSQPPPNAHQMMLEAGRRVRPTPHAASQPVSTSLPSAPRASGRQDDVGSWPEKMQELYGLLTGGKEWGAGWTACVHEWVEVQRMDQFQVDTKTRRKVGEFSSTERPELVTTWIQYKRLPKDREVTDLVAYSVKWWAWWGLCQPEERSMDANGRPGPLVAGLDWTCMDVTSSCGLVLIMVSLSFWGARIFKPGGSSSRQTKDWQDAVSQVTEALAALRGWKAATAGESGKRKSATQPSGSSRSTKRRKA